MGRLICFGTHVIGPESPILCKKRGAERASSSRDEAPPLKKYLWINGISAIVFWVSLQTMMRGQSLIVQASLKFLIYLSTILWLNSGFYLSKSASGIDVESGEFQREQVKLTLWIVGILILSEIPIMVSSI